MKHDEKTFRDFLRNIRGRLKYEARDDLIGTEFFIEGRDKIKENVTRAVKGKIPSIGNLVEGSFCGKYTLLDLTFELNPQPSTCPVAKLRLLQEVGLLTETREEALQASLLGDGLVDSGALFLIEEDLAKEQLFLRLYLNPVNLKMPNYYESEPGLKGLVRSVRQKLFGRTPIDDGQAFIDKSFPILYRVDDACITNACSIWVFKHFYL